jgi:hypothetical protein
MKNAERYTKVRNPRPPNPRRRVQKIKWSQILLGAGLLIFFAPFFRKRHFPEDWADYVQRAGIAVIVVAVFLLVILWNVKVKPSRRHRYILQGNFDVIDKIRPGKKTRLKLHPGSDHLVSVSKDLFDKINIGDKVHVERRLSGEILSVRKVAS